MTFHELMPEIVPGQAPAAVNHALSESLRHAGFSPRPGKRATSLICDLIHDRTGHDFSLYKAAMFQHSIERRTSLLKINDLRQYIHILQDTSIEIDALCRDMLIGVTQFFRDPDSFNALQEHALAALFHNRTDNEPVRIWVCGCSTGEEAYSIAILIRELLQKSGSRQCARIFATDIDRRALEQARCGGYSAHIAADVSASRLKCFFSSDRDQGGYRIKKEVQEMLVFTEHNAMNAPPYSNLDLISCRNMLIYMNSSLQQKLIASFHAALKPDGFLFLGTSETIGDAAAQFKPVDYWRKLFQRRNPHAIHPPCLDSMTGP